MTGAAVIAALAALLVAILFVGAAVVARHRAQSAADLAALAAASAQLTGRGDGCTVARTLARQQDGRPTVSSCEVSGDDVQLEVQVHVRLGLWGVRAARAVARAGPVEPT